MHFTFSPDGEVIAFERVIGDYPWGQFKIELWGINRNGEGLRRLVSAEQFDTFLAERVFDYTDARDRLDLPGTSILSPYLRFGVISPRRAALSTYQAIQSTGDANARQGAETFLNELIWREFYLSVLYHFPNVMKMAFQPALRAVPWRNAPDELHAWQEGITGVPVVDACMRQLAGTAL